MKQTQKDLNKSLQALLSEYPVGISEEPPKLFYESFKLDDLVINLVGIYANTPDGLMIASSSASINDAPLTNAFFKFLERSVVLQTREKFQEQYKTIDTKGNFIGTTSANEVFPSSTDPDYWCYSTLNGVASHLNSELACKAAKRKIIEKDSILRYWYTGCGPSKITPDYLNLWSAYPTLQKYYDIHLCQFDNHLTNDTINICGIFAFPKNDTAPMVYSFGTRELLDEAIICAQNNFLEKLAYSWGQDTQQIESCFSPTPDFHQSYYLQPQSIGKLKSWVLDSDESKRLDLISHAPAADINFADLTPEPAKNKFVTVKAISQSNIPLIFGKNYYVPNFQNQISEDLIIHPVY